MPIKDIEKKRAAWKRWKEKNKDKHRENQRVQQMARYYHPVRQECSIKGCDDIGERHHFDYSKPKEIIWLCKNHHEALHHKSIRTCSFKDCTIKHHANGFCNKHDKQNKRGNL